MNEKDLRRLSAGIALLALILTAPTWLNGKQHVASGYDAPWIYPSQAATAGP